MSYSKQSSLPLVEPVLIEDMKAFLRLPVGPSSQDLLIEDLISGAREDGERLSGLTLAQRTFLQLLDSFPYYTDTVQSQMAYPPSYYSLPQFSTTLWNYSQMIKLDRAPLISVESIIYVGTDGMEHTLLPGTDFIVDPETQLSRMFPLVGEFWPPCLYTPNAVKISFTAGFDPDPNAILITNLPSPPPVPANQQSTYTSVVGIPRNALLGIKNLAAFRFQNRGTNAVPEKIELAFQSMGLIDWAPTRG